MSAFDLFMVQVDFDRTRSTVTLHHVTKLADNPCGLTQHLPI